MRNARVVTLVVACALLAVVPAAAQNQFVAQLRGYEEAPSVSSTGAGVFFAVINDAAETITFQLSYQNLEGQTINAAHIHLGQRVANGGVVAFLCGGGGKPACPPPGAPAVGVITPPDIQAVTSQGIAAGEFSEVVAAIRAGVVYANVHTDKHTGGEIRGQIRPFTPPATAP